MKPFYMYINYIYSTISCISTDWSRQLFSPLLFLGRTWILHSLLAWQKTVYLCTLFIYLYPLSYPVFLTLNQKSSLSKNLNVFPKSAKHKSTSSLFALKYFSKFLISKLFPLLSYIYQTLSRRDNLLRQSLQDIWIQYCLFFVSLVKAGTAKAALILRLSMNLHLPLYCENVGYLFWK